MTRTYIKVPLEWLEGLVKAAKLVDKDEYAVYSLIGYASSAEGIIEYNERVEE